VNLAVAVEGFLAGYFSTCRRSGKTLAAYRIDLAQLQAYIGPSQLLRAVEAEGLESWATDMRSRGYACVSVRRKFATARVFFSYWVRKGVLDKSPLWRIRLDLGRERMLPRSLTALDARLLIEETWREMDSPCSSILRPSDPHFLQVRNLAAIEILFATGMRVGELVSLRLQDWRADDASFVVSGKGSRQRLALLPDDRSIKAVQMYLLRRRAMELGHEALLVNASGQRISTQGIARVLATTAKAAGVATRVTPHMIRHTVATLLLRFGADIRVVQEVLGHASIATTQRYTYVSKEHLLSTLRVRHPSHHLSINTQWQALAS
jgi:site-specific recombinase XerD